METAATLHHTRSVTHTKSKCFWYVDGHLHDVEKEAGVRSDHLKILLATNSSWGRQAFGLEDQDIDALREYFDSRTGTAPEIDKHSHLSKALAKIDAKHPVQLRIFHGLMTIVSYGNRRYLQKVQDALLAIGHSFPTDTIVALCVGGDWAPNEMSFRTTYGEIMAARSLGDLV